MEATNEVELEGMSRRVNFTLNDEQRANLEQAINYSEHPEVRQRAIAVRLLHLGHKPEAVGQMVAITANTVWTWHRRFRQNGVAGLQDQPKSGRKRKADARYVRLLEQLLKRTPPAWDCQLRSGPSTACACTWKSRRRCC
ncbi:MAG: helix-turn-helix domain-containing protein [Chloroflexi bacterium]|nr:helix-turn-helix domain-containing protein [Chloroflexota bacterium]